MEPEAGVVAKAQGPRDLDDLGRGAILEPLLEALRPSSVVVCWIDQPPERDENFSGGRAGPTPAILFEGGPWYASQFPWVEGAKEGVRLALTDLAAQLDADATVLWCAPGRGAGAILASATARRLDSWLRGRGALLDALRLAHQARLDLVAREFALFELLEQSQHDGNAVVRSLRFRLGTRIVRLGRKAIHYSGDP